MFDCRKCSHKQNYPELGESDRCCRFKNMPTEYAFNICKGEHYLDKLDGLSLYAFDEWFKTLDKEDKELPLSVLCGNAELHPIMVLKKANKGGIKWIIHARIKDGGGYK